MTDYKATADQWAHEEHWATESSTAACILELRARVQNLEENLGFTVEAVSSLEDSVLEPKLNSQSTPNSSQIRSSNYPGKPDSLLTPPPELVQLWVDLLAIRSDEAVFSMAAQWGADQELEACCKWLDGEIGAVDPNDLRAARRPKPPSLKEQALAALSQIEVDDTPAADDFFSGIEIIRIALEQLDDWTF